MPEYKPYAATGNRDTPPDILTIMQSIAKDLSEKGYTQRNDGSDVPGDTLEIDAMRVEYYLPWKKFNKKKSRLTELHPNSFEIAKKYHPAFDKMTDTIKALIARNSHLILGENLKDPALFLFVWTPDGAETAKACSIKTGIANQAIKIADNMGIPVFNLKNTGAYDKLTKFISTLE